MAYRHNDLYGNKFTYTLIDQRAYNRSRLKRRLIIGTSISIGVIGVALGTYFLYKKYIKK